MKSPNKKFKTVDEAMEFCEKLEAASKGKHVYRPTMETFSCFHVVKINRKTKLLQTMTERQYGGLCSYYGL